MLRMLGLTSNDSFVARKISSFAQKRRYVLLVTLN